MFRLLGFCLGSAASIALLVITIGVPELNFSADDADVARYDAAIEKLRAKRAAEAQVETETPAPSATSTEAGPTSPPVALDPPAIPVAGAAESAASAPDAVLPPPATGPETPAAVPGADTTEPEWHEFWTPFRTEIAARGFVGRLEAVTGLDYRVKRLESGAYQVAFACEDAADVDGKLAQIAAVTGLDIARNAP